MTASAPRHILLISGGKDSTALAIYMRDRHPEIEMEYVFADTHKELPETYEFLTRLEAYLDRPITRLANDLGDRGFDHYLTLYRDYLPAPNMRWCTRMLKIEPFERYIGEDEARMYIAIRADEHREGYISTRPNIVPVYPFKEEGVNKADVFRILEESGVGLPDYYAWRSRSGCYFCFFQRKSEWVGLLEQHPDLYEKAIDYEKPDAGYTWQQGESLEELRRPERIIQIRQREVDRKAQAAARRRPRTLAEAFGAAELEPEEEQGCLICHL